MDEDMLVFGGSGSPRLTQEICYYLGIPVGKGETMEFSEGTLLSEFSKMSEAETSIWFSRSSTRRTTIHGTPLLDRRIQAFECTVNYRRNALFQLRQRGQERLTPRFNSGPCLCGCD
jgi:hypothetical protein